MILWIVVLILCSIGGYLYLFKREQVKWRIMILINMFNNVFFPTVIPKMYSDNPSDQTQWLRVICTSDTHSHHRELKMPEGDVFIHAGDWTKHGTVEEVKEFNEWLGSLKYKHKIVIAGNHDVLLDQQWYDKNWKQWHQTKQPSSNIRQLLTNCVYLENESYTITTPGQNGTENKIKVYGSPHQVKPPKSDQAFAVPPGSPQEEKSLGTDIPLDTDILVTHGPPYGQLDMMALGVKCGSRALASAIRKVKPRFAIFGHIHEGYGVNRDVNTTYINASCCNLRHRAENPPIVFDYWFNGQVSTAGENGSSSTKKSEEVTFTPNRSSAARGGLSPLPTMKKAETVTLKSREERENVLVQRKEEMIEKARQRFLDVPSS
eukprot:TRINITY_DN18558_c0_g1_i1.p1 TRINITY_DN18558_c0_g1~~TRINITY_DN18558_c0_g1_i1.p1  ORF type:complete len:376 (-),score=89.34 TRINITY_DN18558_c0_g1_i1:71-1198(-)